MLKTSNDNKFNPKNKDDASILAKKLFYVGDGRREGVILFYYCVTALNEIFYWNRMN